MLKKQDAHLLEALIKAYTARAKVFHQGVSAAKIDLLIAKIDSIDPASLHWKLGSLGISRKAFQPKSNTE
ncbi:MAG: hypothetical protein M3410_14555 [Acidobacteriota bacterium]|nr:hypothetical protein [Acidobacteriota bacterium]